MSIDFRSSGNRWFDGFYLFAVILPHVVTVVVAILTYRSSKGNKRRLKFLQTTLNGKADKLTKGSMRVDNQGMK